MSRLPRWAVAGAAAVVAAALLLAVLLVSRAPRTPGPGQGVAHRAAPPATADGKLRTLDDSCFSGYRVQAVGRDAAQVQHIGLTMILKTSPADPPALASLLAQPGCTADVQRLAAGLIGKGKPAGEDGLRISYVTRDGARLTGP